MRIGIDCRTILNPRSGERAGVGHYTYNLVRNLVDTDTKDEFVLFFDYRMPREAALEFERPNVTIRFLPFSSYGKFLPFAYGHLLVAAALTKQRLDVFHSPAGSVPMGYRGKTVVTVHDLAIYVHPQWFPRQLVSTKVLVPRALKSADHLIAVSKSTKRDVQERLHIPAKKVSVIYEAADTALLPLHDQHDNVRKIYQLPKKYVFFVGTIEPRKNLTTLARAWKIFQKKYAREAKGIELILAGGKGYHGEEVLAEVKKMCVGKSMRWIGYVTHNHKILLMKGAAGFAFPSWYEGFGIPVLEALQLGVPTVTSNVSCLPEVAGTAAILIDPHDPKALADGMRKMLISPQIMKERGREQARKFTWAKAAKETLRVYRQVRAE